MKIAVIDVETTGLNPVENRITEIGIVFIEDGSIIGSFEWLINPEVAIPDNIQRLTGITNKMVQGAVAFAEIAHEIDEITRDHIIVGHHVNFDYSFVKNEMKRAGISFTRKTLCTAELAKFIHNDYNSFSLASLCKVFKIKNRQPHRALPDAEVTATLLLKLLSEKENGFFETLFTLKSNLVPEHLRETVYSDLPGRAGVYYFMGKNGKPLYIGKASNLRNRVLSHFRGDGNSLKILALGAKIKNIVFTETGNELMATLLEDHEIRHYWPTLNRAQKKNTIRFGVVIYMDQVGRWRMNIATAGKMHCFIAFFHQYHFASDFIRYKITSYGLNGNLCSIINSEEVPVERHNQNFEQMLLDLKKSRNVEIFFSSGRNKQEKSFVWVENSNYKGFGYIEKENEKDPEQLESSLTLRFSSVTSENIIRKLRESKQPGLEFKIETPV